MKVEIIVLLSALASHAAGSPLAARRGGRRGPSRLPFIVRLPQGSTTPRNGFGRLQSRLPFLALPANSHTTTLRAAPPALALAMHAGEPLRLPGLVLFSNTDEQTTQMTSTQRHIERKNDIKRVPRNIFEAYARDQGIPEHGSMERMTTVRHLRSQSLHEYWTSAPDLVEGRGRRAKDILPAMARISGNSDSNDTSDTDITNDSDISDIEIIDISTSVNTSDTADINNNDNQNNRNITDIASVGDIKFVADSNDDDYLNNGNITDVATISQNNYVPKNSHKNHSNNSNTNDIANFRDNIHVATISDMADARNRNFSSFGGAEGKGDPGGLRAWWYDWSNWPTDLWDRDMDMPVSPRWYTRSTWYPGWEDFFSNHSTTTTERTPTSCPFYKTSPKPEPTKMGMPHHADTQYDVTEPPCLDYYNPVYDLILTLCGHDFMDDMDLSCQARIEMVGLKKTGNDPSFGYY